MLKKGWKKGWNLKRVEKQGSSPNLRKLRYAILEIRYFWDPLPSWPEGPVHQDQTGPKGQYIRTKLARSNNTWGKRKSKLKLEIRNQNSKPEIEYQNQNSNLKLEIETRNGVSNFEMEFRFQISSFDFQFRPPSFCHRSTLLEVLVNSSQGGGLGTRPGTSHRMIIIIYLRNFSYKILKNTLNNKNIAR